MQCKFNFKNKNMSANLKECLNALQALYYTSNKEEYMKKFKK